jgi:hypothetical protein
MVAIMIIFPEDDPTALWAMPLMGLIGGLLGGYVIPLLDYRAESTITISHEGVQRSDSILVLSVPILYLTGFRQRRWTWSQIAFCQIAWAEPQGKRLRLLELFTNSGERLGLVGVPDGIEDGTVVACLKAHGCEVRGL